MEGYGIYFMILERLREEPDYTSVKDYNMLAFDLRTSADKVKSVIEEFGLFSFTDDGKRFYSEGFMKRMALKDEVAEKKSKAGKASAERRWGKKSNENNKTVTPVTKTVTPVTEIHAKEKESKPKNSPPTPPLGECGGADLDFANDCVPEKEPPAKEPGLQEQRFAVFWQAYPKKRGIGEAERAFRKIKPSQELLEKMLLAIEQAKWSDDWTRENKRFVPNPATWLNQRRWDDEPPPTSAQSNRRKSTTASLMNVTDPEEAKKIFYGTNNETN